MLGRELPSWSILHTAPKLRYGLSYKSNKISEMSVYYATARMTNTSQYENVCRGSRPDTFIFRRPSGAIYVHLSPDENM